MEVNLPSPGKGQIVSHFIPYDKVFQVDMGRNVMLCIYIQVSEYRSGQEEAKRKHLNIWQYGDVTDDDAHEFGMER